MYQSGSILGKSAVFSTVYKHFWSVEWCGLDFYGRCINVVGKKLKYNVPYVLFIPSHMLYNLTLLYLVHILLLYNYVFYYL